MKLPSFAQKLLSRLLWTHYSGIALRGLLPNSRNTMDLVLDVVSVANAMTIVSHGLWTSTPAAETSKAIRDEANVKSKIACENAGPSLDHHLTKHTKTWN